MHGSADLSALPVASATTELTEDIVRESESTSEYQWHEPPASPIKLPQKILTIVAFDIPMASSSSFRPRCRREIGTIVPRTEVSELNLSVAPLGLTSVCRTFVDVIAGLVAHEIVQVLRKAHRRRGGEQ